MSPAGRTCFQRLIFWAAPLAVLACGGEGGTDVVLPALRITTATSGVELDPDGYSVAIDGQAPQPIGTNATLITEDLPAGQHTVELSGIADNCTVGGENPRPVSVVAGSTASVAFVITCSPLAGLVQIVTTTTGSDIDPDGFALLFDGTDRGPIGANATSSVTDATPGTHTIGLTGIAANCQISGENPRAIEVVAGGTSQVAFALACTAVGATTGSLQVATTTTGEGTDPDGFALLFDGADQGPIGLNATSSVAGLPAGSHTIGLTGVAANCEVAGDNPRVVTVPAGGTAQVAFTVTCSVPGPGTGTVRVVTGTTGAGTDPDGFSLLLDGTAHGPIGLNSTSSLAGLTAGSHTIGLTGIAANCQVSGENPRSATVPAGGTIQVTFAVACTATGPTTGTLVIATVTTGSALDADGYLLSVDGGPNQPIGTNATARLTNVAAGQHTVRLLGLATNCSVTGDNPLGVAVQAGETARVSFAVTCAATVGALRVTVEGLPGGVAAAVTVEGPNDFSQQVTATRTLSDLVPGSYAVSAEEVESGDNTYRSSVSRPTVPVVAGATATVTVSYTPIVVAPTLNLRIDGLYLTQSTQTYTSDVPLIAGRNGYLRVFVVANEANSARPSVRVRLSHPGAADRSFNITGPSSVPREVNEGSLPSSWNLQVPGSLIQPGLSIVAELDPEDAIGESNESDNRFPVSGTKALTVRSVPVARIRFISVQQEGSTESGNVSNPSQLVELARRMHPLGAIDVDVDPEVFPASLPLGANGSGWGQLLSDLDGKRVAEGTDRIYFGIAKVGYAREGNLVGLTLGQGVPTAAGWDNPSDAGRVVAHELGHVWGRRHSPCGNPPDVDPLYPYSGGQIGVYGMDVERTALKSRTSPDIMAYCFADPWISDYTYRQVMSFRATAGTQMVAAPQPALLIWGRVVNGRPILEPAFEIVTRPSLPSRPGPYTVSATAADGSRLFNLSFDVAAIEDHATGTGHFAFAVPLDPGRASRLVTMRLDGPTGTATLQTLAQLRAGPAPETIVARREGENVSLRWNAATHPMIMVRDPDSGEVLSFGRGGSAVVRTTKSELDIDVSDGVRSQRVRLAISRS